MGSGGAPGTGGNTNPTPCSFPSSWTVGSATYTTYSLPNAVTACGYNGSNNNIKNIANGAYFAAIPGNSSSDFNTSNRCGACIQIGSAIVTIVDECPYDGNNNPPCKANPTGHMDLSNAAASAGGVKGDPNVHGQNQWKYVPCPVTGNVIVRLKPGNNNEIFIENEIVPIASVTCDGQNGSRTSYGAWHFNSNVPGASCDVTDVANRRVTITVGSTQGQDVDTKVQFPKCQ
jgi:expansin (peptidoglycan-binding protein)